MRYGFSTLLTQFTIRDLLWLTAIIALIVVWRTDVAKQQAVYRDRLRFRMSDYSSEFDIILHVAERHPELLTELKAFDADFNKHVSERASLNHRFGKLENKARDLYRRDKENDPVAFSGEEPAKDPFSPQSK